MNARDFRDLQPVHWEESAPRKDICERVENEQIARILVHPDVEPGPGGGQNFGLEFTSGLRMIVEAVPDFTEGVETPWRLRVALIEDPNMIWTPRVTKHFTRDRRQADGTAPTPLEDWVEGQVIKSVRVLPTATALGGEAVEFRFSDRSRMVATAMPPRPGDRGKYTASYGLGLSRPKQIVVGRPTLH